MATEGESGRVGTDRDKITQYQFETLYIDLFQ